MIHIDRPVSDPFTSTTSANTSTSSPLPSARPTPQPHHAQLPGSKHGSAYASPVPQHSSLVNSHSQSQSSKSSEPSPLSSPGSGEGASAVPLPPPSSSSIPPETPAEDHDEGAEQRQTPPVLSGTTMKSALSGRSSPLSELSAEADADEAAPSTTEARGMDAGPETRSPATRPPPTPVPVSTSSPGAGPSHLKGVSSKPPSTVGMQARGTPAPSASGVKTSHSASPSLSGPSSGSGVPDLSGTLLLLNAELFKILSQLTTAHIPPSDPSYLDIRTRLQSSLGFLDAAHPSTNPTSTTPSIPSKSLAAIQHPLPTLDHIPPLAPTHPVSQNPALRTAYQKANQLTAILKSLLAKESKRRGSTGSLDPHAGAGASTSALGAPSPANGMPNGLTNGIGSGIGVTNGAGTGASPPSLKRPAPDDEAFDLSSAPQSLSAQHTGHGQVGHGLPSQPGIGQPAHPGQPGQHVRSASGSSLPGGYQMPSHPHGPYSQSHGHGHGHGHGQQGANKRQDTRDRTPGAGSGSGVGSGSGSVPHSSVGVASSPAASIGGGGGSVGRATPPISSGGPGGQGGGANMHPAGMGMGTGMSMGPPMGRPASQASHRAGSLGAPTPGAGPGMGPNPMNTGMNPMNPMNMGGNMNANMGGMGGNMSMGANSNMHMGQMNNGLMIPGATPSTPSMGNSHAGQASSPPSSSAGPGTGGPSPVHSNPSQPMVPGGGLGGGPVGPQHMTPQQHQQAQQLVHSYLSSLPAAHRNALMNHAKALVNSKVQQALASGQGHIDPRMQTQAMQSVVYQHCSLPREKRERAMMGILQSQMGGAQGGQGGGGGPMNAMGTLTGGGGANMGMNMGGMSNGGMNPGNPGSMGSNMGGMNMGNNPTNGNSMNMAAMNNMFGNSAMGNNTNNPGMGMPGAANMANMTQQQRMQLAAMQNQMRGMNPNTNPSSSSVSNTGSNNPGGFGNNPASVGSPPGPSDILAMGGGGSNNAGGMNMGGMMGGGGSGMMNPMGGGGGGMGQPTTAGGVSLNMHQQNALAAAHQRQASAGGAMNMNMGNMGMGGMNMNAMNMGMGNMGGGYGQGASGQGQPSFPGTLDALRSNPVQNPMAARSSQSPSFGMGGMMNPMGGGGGGGMMGMGGGGGGMGGMGPPPVPARAASAAGRSASPSSAFSSAGMNGMGGMAGGGPVLGAGGDMFAQSPVLDLGEFGGGFDAWGR